MSGKKCLLKTKSKKLEFHSAYRCGICKKSYKKFIIFEGHFAFNARCRRNYGLFLQCYICSQSFSHLAVLKYHLRRHHINKNADFKRNSSSTHRSDDEHMVTHSKSGNTEIAKKDQPTKSYFLQRANGNSNCLDEIKLEKRANSKFDCEKCKLPFTTEVSLKFHQKLLHPCVQPTKPKQSNTCDICNAKFSFINNLTRHKRDHVIGEVKCKVCLIRFTKQSLAVHAKEAHPKLTNDEVYGNVAEKRKRDEDDDRLENGQPVENVEKVGTGKKYQFQCKFCGKFFKFHSHIVRHEKSHKGKFKCRVCKVPFTMKALESHINRVHPDQGKSSNETKNVLAGHKNRVHSDQGKSSNETKNALAGHKNRVHSDDSDQQKSAVQCHFCKNTQLVRHKQIHRGAFKCEICRIPSTKNTLIAHKSRCRPNQRTNIVKRTQNSHSCPICKKLFHARSRLILHSRTHKGSYKCVSCQIPFTKNALKMHNSRHHSGAGRSNLINDDSPQSGGNNDNTQKLQETKKLLHRCQFCKKDFDRLCHLSRHGVIHKSKLKCSYCKIPFTLRYLRFHEKRCIESLQSKKKEKLQFKCNVCEVICNSPSNLEQHKRVHTSGKHKCELCNIRFSVTTLKLHQKFCRRSDDKSIITPEPTITEEVPSQISYNCDQCERQFSRNCYLQMHLKSHRQYSCNVCGRNFGGRHLLGKHFQLHRFECYVCRIRFPSTNLSNLSNHIKKHILYEKWVNPLDVYLSNWSPEKSREILQNQPLVLVENLNINNMNLNLSVALEKPHKIVECTEVPPVIEKVERKNETDVPINMNSETPSANECTASFRINIELKYSEPQPIYDDNDEEHRNPANTIVNMAVSSDNEEISIVDELPDSTSTYDDDNEKVIDVSSESDVDDVLELFHCYFCDETYRSLDALGIHVKKCKLCP